MQAYMVEVDDVISTAHGDAKVDKISHGCKFSQYCLFYECLGLSIEHDVVSVFAHSGQYVVHPTTLTAKRLMCSMLYKMFLLFGIATLSNLTCGSPTTTALAMSFRNIPDIIPVTPSCAILSV